MASDRPPLRWWHALGLPLIIGIAVGAFLIVGRGFGPITALFYTALVTTAGGAVHVLTWLARVGAYAQSSEEAPEDTLESVEERIRQVFPIEKYIATWGPLRWSSWQRRMEKYPEVHEELKSIPEGEDSRKLADCVSRHPELRRIVTKEYALCRRHMARPVLYGEKKLKSPRTKSREWKGLYQRLKATLKRHGMDDPMGNGDFYLVTEEVGEPGHKVEVQNPSVLCPEMIADIQRDLVGWENNWYLVLTLEVDELGLDTEPGFLVIWSDHVEEHWDAVALRQQLGERFRL